MKRYTFNSAEFKEWIADKTCYTRISFWYKKWESDAVQHIPNGSFFLEKKHVLRRFDPNYRETCLDYKTTDNIPYFDLPYWEAVEKDGKFCVQAYNTK